MNYKIKSLIYLSCFMLTSMVYHYYNESPDEPEYASLEEIRISHENLKKVSEEIRKNLD